VIWECEPTSQTIGKILLILLKKVTVWKVSGVWNTVEYYLGTTGKKIFLKKKLSIFFLRFLGKKKNQVVYAPVSLTKKIKIILHKIF
jgi:hypothetical protein